MSKASSSSKKPPKSTSTSKTNKTKQGNAHKQRNANENDIIESESESPSTSDLLSKIARLETELAKESAYQTTRNWSATKRWRFGRFRNARCVEANPSGENTSEHSKRSKPMRIRASER